MRVLTSIIPKLEFLDSMAAAFGSGAIFTLVSGVGGQNQLSNAVVTGVFFAAVQGGLFKVSFVFISC